MADPKEAQRAPDLDLFRALVETRDAVAYVFGLDQPLSPPLYLSPQAERILGVPRSQLERPSALLSELVHLDDRERIMAVTEETIRTHGFFDEEYRIVLPDGSVKWLRDRARVLAPEGNRPLLWLGFAIDVTARREAQQEARLDAASLRNLIDETPGTVYQLSTERPSPHTTFMSSQIHELLGQSPEDWVGDPNFWFGLLHPDDYERVSAAWYRAIDTITPFDQEYRIRRTDGTYVWLRDRTVPVFAADGELLAWQGLATDITVAKNVEQELRATGARYRALVEQLPAVVYVDSNDAPPRSLYVSPNSEEILGLTTESGIEDDDLWPSRTHPDDRERVGAAWRRSVETGAPFDEQYRLVRPDGRIVQVRDTSRRIGGQGGEPFVWQGVILDISAQVRAEEDLRTSEARYRALVEGIPAVIYEMDPDDERRTLFVNPQIEQLLGYTRQEWLDQPDIWIELLHSDDREIELAAHDQHTETGEPWRREYRLIASDGRVVWVRDQAVLLRDEGGHAATWQGVMLDITAQKEAEEQLRLAKEELEFRVLVRTNELADANEMMTLEIGERRRAERELRETEERYRHLVEELPAVIYTWQVRPSEDGTEHWYISPQLEQLLGFSPSEFLDGGWDAWYERVHPHDRDRVYEVAARCARTGDAFEEEYRFLDRDGRVVWVLDSATLMQRDSAGRPFVYQGVMLDITARKQAEDKAAAAENRFRELVESGPIMAYAYEVVSRDPPSIRIDHVSPRIAQAIGYVTSELGADLSRWFSLVHPDDRERVTAESQRIWNVGGEYSIGYRMIAADGRVVWLNDRGRCVRRDDSGAPRRFVGMMLDVTAEREEHLELRENQDRIRAVLEGLPTMPWTEIVDPASGWRRFTYIGPQVYDAFGYTAEELMTEPRHFERMVHPDDLERVLSLSTAAERTRDSWEDVYRVVKRDGQVVWVHSRGERVTGEGVVPAGWHGIATVIEEDVAAALLVALGLAAGSVASEAPSSLA